MLQTKKFTQIFIIVNTLFTKLIKILALIFGKIIHPISNVAWNTTISNASHWKSASKHPTKKTCRIVIRDMWFAGTTLLNLNFAVWYKWKWVFWHTVQSTCKKSTDYDSGNNFKSNMHYPVFLTFSVECVIFRFVDHTITGSLSPFIIFHSIEICMFNNFIHLLFGKRFIEKFGQ